MQSLNRNYRSQSTATSYSEKIVQFGEGNFLRAFVDWMVYVMNQEANFNGSVVVVQPLEQGMIDHLNKQDGLYTLYLQGMKNSVAVKEHNVIDSISRGINPYQDHEAYLALSSSSDLRFVVSNTTEAGIAYDPHDKLDDRPQNSFPGKLTAFLYRRYVAFQGSCDKGLIIIPCELIDRNGDKLKKVVLQYATLWKLEQSFIDWIEECNTFCSSLVDRIVPGYPRDSIAEITEELGYEDGLVVVGEQFHLWVIEGPQWIKEELPVEVSRLNIVVVDDMAPYRTRKVRILNGAHTAMMPVAYLYGLDTVGESIDHEIVGKYVRDLIEHEIIPTLDMPQEELKSFAEDVIERFRNPFVQHYLMSISLNSISKFKTRNLPSLLEYVNRTSMIPYRLAFSLAALIIFYRGKRREESYQVSDDASILEFFGDLWDSWDGTIQTLKKLVVSALGNATHWELDLNQVPGLSDVVLKDVINIDQLGMMQALQQLMQE
ncbi:tagaturonate reductase [Paenibacillus crassostreae]|uniref:Altronate oxidoreductase n=1 Tax=Paenibacillus crassostreae TaxID=1763538 RepID=A0A167B026_9BACL|nr:tagaturonate reductase [Paenibacillus crassostreae]AOZ93586.1 altronate oxidoreductase [Paenibacillus crassostreae]OAB71618.1 altronate oxidoreductase [Paenibacillus crassostreae]